MLQSSIQLYRNAYHGLPVKIWWLSFVILVNRAGTMVIPFLTLYLTGKDFTLTQAGYAVAAFGAGAIAGGYLGGRLTDKFGFYYVQVISLLLNGLMFFALSRMQTLPQIIACIFILSTLGESFRPANSAAIAFYSNESNRIRCYSLNRLAVNLGWAIGPALGGIISQFSFQWLFWVDGTTCIIAAIVLFITQTGQQVSLKKDTGHNNPIQSAYKDKLFLAGMLYIFMIAVCFFQMFNVVSYYYEQHLHLSKFTIGCLLGMNGLIIFLIEMVLVYKLEGRYNAFNYMIAGTFLIAVSYITLNIAPVFSIAVISMLLITFGEMLLFPFINNFWVKRSNDNNRGQYAAVYAMAFAAAQVLAPTVSSAIAFHSGFYWLWIFDFAVCLLAMLGFIFLKRTIETNE